MRTEHFTWQDLGLLLYRLGVIERSVSDNEDGYFSMDGLTASLQGSCLSEEHFFRALNRESSTLRNEIETVMWKNLSEMPLYINDDRQFAREIAKWRLEINK